MIGKQKLALLAGQNRLQINTKVPLLFSVDGEPEYACGAGKNKLIIKNEKDIELEIDPSDPKAKYAIAIKYYDARKAEKIDDKAPPQPAAPQSWLAAMRVKVRQEMGITRENFAEHRSRYQDEANHEWEEDLDSSSQGGLVEDGTNVGEAANESAEQREADQSSDAEAQDKA